MKKLNFLTIEFFNLFHPDQGFSFIDFKIFITAVIRDLL